MSWEINEFCWGEKLKRKEKVKKNTQREKVTEKGKKEEMWKIVKKEKRRKCKIV